MKNVRGRNEAGMTYHGDAFKPSTFRVLRELAGRGVLLQRGESEFLLPEFAAVHLSGNTTRRSPAPAPARSFTSRAKPKLRDLPPNYPPSSARVGDIVSVVGPGETIATLGQSVFSYGTIEALPGPGKYGTVSTEPAVTFATGALQGMTRHVRWDRIYAGYVSNDVAWKKWKMK